MYDSDEAYVRELSRCSIPLLRDEEVSSGPVAVVAVSNISEWAGLMWGVLQVSPAGHLYINGIVGVSLQKAAGADD